MSVWGIHPTLDYSLITAQNIVCASFVPQCFLSSFRFVKLIANESAANHHGYSCETGLPHAPFSVKHPVPAVYEIHDDNAVSRSSHSRISASISSVPPSAISVARVSAGSSASSSRSNLLRDCCRISASIAG